MAEGITTFKIEASSKGLGEVQVFAREAVTSGMKVRIGQTGLLSTQSTTIQTGTMSGGIYNIMITNYSTTILNCATSAGLFVFFSGMTYLSGMLVVDGDFCKFRRHLNFAKEGIHLYAPQGGNAFQFVAYGI